MKLSQLESGLNRLNSNPDLEHGSKPTSSGCSTFKKLVQMASYHSIANMQCSSPCPNMVAIRSHHKGGICSNQSAGTAQPTEVLNFTTAGKALWTQQAQQTLSFTFFSGAVHYSSLTMQIHSDSSNICSCFKQGNRKTHLSKKQEYRLIIRINFSRQTSFPPISQLCSCHYSYGSKCHFTK